MASKKSSLSDMGITVSFDGKQIEELKTVGYEIARETTPIYVLDSPDPRSFSRGSRGMTMSMTMDNVSVEKSLLPILGMKSTWEFSEQNYTIEIKKVEGGKIRTMVGQDARVVSMHTIDGIDGTTSASLVVGSFQQSEAPNPDATNEELEYVLRPLDDDMIELKL